MKNYLLKLGKKAKDASSKNIKSEKKDRVLNEYCNLLKKNRLKIISQNKKDLKQTAGQVCFSGGQDRRRSNRPDWSSSINRFDPCRNRRHCSGPFVSYIKERTAFIDTFDHWRVSGWDPSQATEPRED